MFYYAKLTVQQELSGIKWVMFEWYWLSMLTLGTYFSFCFFIALIASLTWSIRLLRRWFGVDLYQGNELKVFLLSSVL